MSNPEESLADKLFPKSISDDFSESILTIPPEQRRLHTETYDFSISTISEHLKSDHIFVPRFQRRYVWSQSQASRLIESLIIQCPIPVIYLSQESDERLSVIDGNQRVRTLERFLNNQFELKGLTAYPELEGLRFFQLDPRFQRHILNRTLRCIVIMKDTHPQVKFDVFERLNSGAVKLTPQELRHGLYHGKLMTLVTDLAKKKQWQTLFAMDSKRMRQEEFVIRLFALHFDFNKYKNPMSAFLNDYSKAHRNLTDVEAANLRSLFDKTLHGIDIIFGEYAFKLFDTELAVFSKFNVALFDAEVLAVSNLEKVPHKLTATVRQKLLVDLGELFVEEDFLKTVTRATGNEASLKKRVADVRKVVLRHI